MPSLCISPKGETRRPAPAELPQVVHRRTDIEIPHCVCMRAGEGEMRRDGKGRELAARKVEEPRGGGGERVGEHGGGAQGDGVGVWGVVGVGERGEKARGGEGERVEVGRSFGSWVLEGWISGCREVDERTYR